MLSSTASKPAASAKVARGRTRQASSTMPNAVAIDILRLKVAAGAGSSELPGVSERCRRALAVADAVGAPLLDAMDGAGAAEEDHRRAERAVAVASAQTRTVAAGLLIAPVLLVPGLGRLIGADLIGFYRSTLGIVVLIAGTSLLLLGAMIIWVLLRRVGGAAVGDPGRRRARIGAAMALVVAAVTWRSIGPALAPLLALITHHLVTRGRAPKEPVRDVDEAADLTATALSGGVTMPHALRIAADHLPSLAIPLRRMAFDLEFGHAFVVAEPPGWSPQSMSGASRVLDEKHGGGPSTTPLARMHAVLTTASEVGAPSVSTLRRLAQDLRADDLARVLAAAERLPAQLTFPTALCLLPATVLLVGAPIVHAGLTAAGT